MANARLVFERVGRDGSHEVLTLRPADIHAALTALSFERDALLRLHGAHDDGLDYDLSVLPTQREQVVVRLRRGAQERWLARTGDETPLEEMSTVPHKALVPRTWASSALALATTTAHWPPTLPWHDAQFRPVAPLSLEPLSFTRVAADPSSAVRAIADTLVRHIDASQEPALALAEVIAELRRVGHDLWSIDRDGELEIWGGDYMREAEGKGLWLEVETKKPAHARVRFGAASAEA